MAEIYLSGHPSRSWSMRNLGSPLVNFLVKKPQWAKKKLALALEVARFEWAQIEAFDAASKPPLDSDSLASAAADKLKLGLQPHLQLLELMYPVDDFVLVVKGEEVLRAQASNAVDSRPRRATHLKKTAPPKRRLTHVAIHRYRNALYYKRLEPKAYALLKALQSGSTVAEACEKVLGNASTPADWQEKVQSWFKSWSSLGWFCAASSEDTALKRSYSKRLIGKINAARTSQVTTSLRTAQEDRPSIN